VTGDHATDARDPARWVDQHGDALFRFALLRVRDADLAADLVQETFLSALKGLDGFHGRSSIRTWMTGILKHKIIDYYRRNRSEVLESDLGPTGSEMEHAESLLPSWNESPARMVERRNS
jgi:RNA polymerase sigma-70 factor (ECF subfamily)